MQNNKVKYGDIIIEYSVDRSKRKHLYICVTGGEVLVKAPLTISAADIEKAVIDKRKWIIGKLALTSVIQPKPKEYISGECFKVLGKSCTLKIIYDDIKSVRVERNGYKLFAFVPIAYKNDESKKQESIKIALDSFYKQKAASEINESMDKMSRLTGLIPAKITVRKLKSSWGRCSSKNNITINQNVVMYPRSVIDYVVLHELCHLKYFNHSRDFWNLIKLYTPDYRRYYEELRVKVYDGQ